MEIRRRSVLSLLLILIIFSFLVISPVFAADGTITVVPASGTHNAGSVISASVKVNGGGTLFNAVKATIKLNPSAPVKSLLLGDCSFSFIKTPTTDDPSFVGVILGGSTSSCTVYSMTFQPNASGTQLLQVTDGSIKSYPDAHELFTNSTNGSYTITGSQTGSIASVPNIPQISPPIVTAGTKFYSVSYSIALPKNVDPSKVSVVLDGQAPSSVQTLPAPNNSAGPIVQATFSQVPEGVHTLSATAQGKKLSEQIVNVSGENGNLTFGYGVQKQSTTWIWYVVGAIAILIAGAVVFIIYRKRRNQTPNPLDNTPVET